jgi:2-haloacid dehalogenase
MADRPVIAFDLMGTLLDLSALDSIFRVEFGGSRVRREWFSEALQLAFSITAAGEYESFAHISEIALKVVEQRHGHAPSKSRRKKVFDAMRNLPPFPDVAPGLLRLSARGFRMCVLTNSGEKAARQALESAGLTRFFETVFSAERVKALKPAPEPYEFAAKKMKVKRRNLLLVAAHAWDVRGAASAGCQTCFVRRPEQVLDELTPKPDFIVSYLLELAADLD